MAIVEILGVKIDQVTFDGALEQIESFIHQRGPHQVVTVNPEFIMRAQSDAEFRRVLNQADLAVPDGAGLLWASRILERRSQKRIGKHPKKTLILPERVTGVDLLIALMTRAAEHGWKVYLLGGSSGMANRTAAYFSTQLPKLKIVGAEIGPLINEEGQPINHDQQALLDAVLARIEHTKPDLLFVAFGAPKQERFIARYAKHLKVPVMIGVGGAFDFIGGKAHRAPIILQKLWLEWLWRLITEPWRAGRIWTATVRFPLTILFRK